MIVLHLHFLKNSVEVYYVSPFHCLVTYCLLSKDNRNKLDIPLYLLPVLEMTGLCLHREGKETRDFTLISVKHSLSLSIHRCATEDYWDNILWRRRSKTRGGCLHDTATRN